MNGLLITAMPGESAPATRLAVAMNTPMQEIAVHRFPDGESRVRAMSAAKTTIVYCSLDRPNEKLIELALAASALRDLGAERLVLVAPYLCYMRQDTAFTKGEAVSQRVIGRMLSNWFDRVVTIEPHLHRIRSLHEVFPDMETTAVSAAPLLAQLIRNNCSDVSSAVIVGPDLESQKWAEAVAAEVGTSCAILQKTRSGDKSVAVSLNGHATVAGKQVFLVDDVASTGETLAAAARLLHSISAQKLEALIVHALFDEDADRHMRNAGLSRLWSTDSVRHPTNAIEIAPLLAGALSKESPS